MKAVLERIEKLIALSASSNEHEARNAALLAVQLIQKHKVVLSMPAGRVKTPTPSRRRSTPKAAKKIVDPPEKIVAPLGGDCVHCGGRYRAEQTIFWFSSRGGMHLKCFEEWVKK